MAQERGLHLDWVVLFVLFARYRALIAGSDNRSGRRNGGDARIVLLLVVDETLLLTKLLGGLPVGSHDALVGSQR